MSWWNRTRKNLKLAFGDNVPCDSNFMNLLGSLANKRDTEVARGSVDWVRPGNVVDPKALQLARDYLRDTLELELSYLTGFSRSRAQQVLADLECCVRERPAPGAAIERARKGMGRAERDLRLLLREEKR